MWLSLCVVQYPEDAVQLNAAVTLYHVASHKRTQHLVVKKGICMPFSFTSPHGVMRMGPASAECQWLISLSLVLFYVFVC